jgi:hypothetical protein
MYPTTWNRVEIFLSAATLYIGMAKHVLSSHLCLFLLFLFSLTHQVPSLWGTRYCHFFFHIARHCTLPFLLQPAQSKVCWCKRRRRREDSRIISQ